MSQPATLEQALRDIQRLREAVVNMHNLVGKQDYLEVYIEADRIRDEALTATAHYGEID